MLQFLNMPFTRLLCQKPEFDKSILYEIQSADQIINHKRISYSGLLMFSGNYYYLTSLLTRFLTSKQVSKLIISHKKCRSISGLQKTKAKGYCRLFTKPVVFFVNIYMRFYFYILYL